MSIKRYNIGDDIETMLRAFDFSRPTFSYLKGEWFNPDEYDLVPKKGVIERQLKEKEEQLRLLSERHRMVEKQLQDEIDGYKKKLTG